MISMIACVPPFCDVFMSGRFKVGWFLVMPQKVMISAGVAVSVRLTVFPVSSSDFFAFGCLFAFAGLWPNVFGAR